MAALWRGSLVVQGGEDASGGVPSDALWLFDTFEVRNRTHALGRDPIVRVVI